MPLESIKSIDASTARSDESPKETVVFDFGPHLNETFGDLAVDPNNPNTDGRDVLTWQRGDVRLDDGEAGIKDGTSNTLMIGEIVKPAPAGRTDGVFNSIPPALPTEDEVLIAFEHGDVRAGDGYSGAHILYQDVVVPASAVAMETITIAHEGLLLI
jgi:hypothetical protein